MNFLTKLAQQEYELSEQEQFDEALSELNQDQLDAFQQSASATPRLDKLAQNTAIADRMGRELAREHGAELIKQALFLPSAAGIGVGKQLAAHALRSPGAAMAAGGAAVGGIAGALGGGGVDPATGQRKSRLKAGLIGAGLGAGAGYGISKIPIGGGANIGSGLRKAVVGKGAAFGTKAQQYGRTALKDVYKAEATTFKGAPKAVNKGAKDLALRRGANTENAVRSHNAAVARPASDPSRVVGTAKPLPAANPTTAAMAPKNAPALPAAPAAPPSNPQPVSVTPRAPVRPGSEIAASNAASAPAMPATPTRRPAAGASLVNVRGGMGKKKLASMSPVERMKYVLSR